MHLRDSGIFDVTPSEHITFTVTRKDPRNKAEFAPRKVDIPWHAV